MAAKTVVIDAELLATLITQKLILYAGMDPAQAEVMRTTSIRAMAEAIQEVLEAPVNVNDGD